MARNENITDFHDRQELFPKPDPVLPCMPRRKTARGATASAPSEYPLTMSSGNTGPKRPRAVGCRKGEEVVLADEVGPGRCRLSDENRIRIGLNHRSNNGRSRECVPSHDQEEVPRLVDPFGASQATEHWIGKSAVAPVVRSSPPSPSAGVRARDVEGDAPQLKEGAELHCLFE